MGPRRSSNRMDVTDGDCRSGGGVWFCDKIPRRKYVDVAFIRNGGKCSLVIESERKSC